MELTPDLAGKFARIALGHVAQEFPNKLDHVMAGAGDVKTPRELHPAFYGSFDWHSCVHSWWMLLSVRRLFPDLSEAHEIADLADLTFSADNIGKELSYLDKPESRGFERPYGWAWLLYLHHEASQHGDREWAARIEPLAQAFAKRFKSYLSILTYPITVGTHTNTAFALTLAREWAEGRDPELVDFIDRWAINAFAERSDYAGWEPGGDEFLSPVLTAAILMGKVLRSADFEPWLKALVIDNGWVERECRPVTVSDRSDGKISHLDGLNLSRAWCLSTLAKMHRDDGFHKLACERADSHLNAAMDHVSGDYMGEHWLASFALLALLQRQKVT